MIRTVVCKMLQHLPKRLLPGYAGYGPVGDDALQILRCERGHVVKQVTFQFRRAAAHGLEIRKITGHRGRFGRPPMPPLEPYPLCSADVHERVSNRAETRAEVARELLVVECFARTERAVIRPGIVVVE